MFPDRWSRIRSLAGLALVLCLAGCVSTDGPRAQMDPKEARLVELMVRRLEIGRQVAWIKFQKSAPVADPTREAEFLAAMETRGSELGVDPLRVREFFGAQIRASRELQNELISGWQRGATIPPFAPWDLKRHIRPELDQVSEEMLVCLSRGSVEGRADKAEAIRKLREAGFSWPVAWMATRPL